MGPATVSQKHAEEFEDPINYMLFISVIGSTEYLSSSTKQWIRGPQMPENISAGCVIALDEDGTRHLLLGGRNEVMKRLKNTWIFDWEGSQTWEHAGLFLVVRYISQENVK